MYRIGQGFDLHQFAEDRDLILGGVKIEHNKGLLGHSDADALCHAIIDALLGALALGDIGQHFPDTDPKYYGADSTQLLAETLYLIVREGYKINNIDATIKTQYPRLGPFIKDIQKNLASILNLQINQVSIKAKSMEWMGPIGEGKCLAVDAVVLLEEIAI
ncbi:MAG: 2-C-methyl-D-erythritol 2,4-cyclodiphosphate synthase [Clostridium sp.]|nr:2-C-methyl-D-erythritol 2,4-cyclodiphosphate synthase [Clostridium sp.]